MTENNILLEQAEQNKKFLVEKWNDVISEDADDLKAITKTTDKHNLAQLLENQEIYNETTTVSAGDLGVFTPILVPTVRRIFPSLVANQIVGVQPMQQPTGYAFALRYGYGGDDTRNATGNLTKHRGDTASNKAASDFKTGSLVGIYAGDITAGITDGDSVRDASSGGGNIHGTVIHHEYSDGLTKVLIEMVVTTSPTYDFPIPTDGSTAVYFTSSDTTGRTTISLITNEAGYNTILKNYSGPVSTSTGETLGASDDMKTMKMGIERVSVEAKTRKLKAEYSLEMAQDLRAVHNLNAEAELMNILQYEIASEIDRELVDAINDNATTASPWTYGTGGAPSTAVADGQWEQEKIRTLYSRIIRESNAIAITTRRGPGNFIIASPNVISALESLNNFMYSPVPNDVGPISGVTMVGTLDNRFKVYVDTFYTDPVNNLDYVTVGYKGPSNMDTGVIFCPYIPIMMQKVTHEKTFQPAIGVQTRSAICFNLFGTDNFYKKVVVNLGNSAFA